MKQLTNYDWLVMIDNRRKNGILDPRDIATDIQKEMDKEWSYKDVYAQISMIFNNEDELDNNII